MWHLYRAARRRRNEQWYPPARLARLRAQRLRQLDEIACQTRIIEALFTALASPQGNSPKMR
jgi:hypothetical protein